MFRMLWAQSILPFWAKQDNVDLFWSPAHRLPRYLSKSTASVVTIHDLVWRYAPETMRPFSRFLDAKFMPEAISIADKVIAVSVSTAQDIFIEAPKVESKTLVIYEAGLLSGEIMNDVDNSKGKYILFVGTLEPRKNLRRLLQAYSLLSVSIRHQYSLLIVGGEGWGNENLELIIAQLNIKKFVTLLGYLSNKELINTYSNACLFVMPSLYEGFGLPLLEAMSFGVPVVTSNISSMPEVGGKAAILVDPHSVISIKNGIEKVLLSNDLWDELSLNGLERSKLFSWDKASKETIDVFEKALFVRSKLSS